MTARPRTWMGATRTAKWHAMRRRCGASGSAKHRTDSIRNSNIRRSKLDEFVVGSREAAKQLVGNLNRAADLIQSFKQVAVDRSHAERRLFDLRESTEHIIASLRPALKRSSISLSVDIPDGIVMDGYPGPYGQVLTNLVLNALVHGFP